MSCAEMPAKIPEDWVPLNRIKNPLNSGNTPMIPEKVPLSSGKVPMSSGKVPMSSGGEPMSSEEKKTDSFTSTTDIKQIGRKFVKQVVHMCEKRYIEILIVISTTCFALLSHILNVRTAPPLQPRENTLTFNQLVVYDCLLHNISFLHALIQVSSCITF